MLSSIIYILYNTTFSAGIAVLQREDWMSVALGGVTREELRGRNRKEEPKPDVSNQVGVANGAVTRCQ